VGHLRGDEQNRLGAVHEVLVRRDDPRVPESPHRVRASARAMPLKRGVGAGSKIGALENQAQRGLVHHELTNSDRIHLIIRCRWPRDRPRIVTGQPRSQASVRRRRRCTTGLPGVEVCTAGGRGKPAWRQRLLVARRSLLPRPYATTRTATLVQRPLRAPVVSAPDPSFPLSATRRLQSALPESVSA
jgi:hypothetical protein